MRRVAKRIIVTISTPARTARAQLRAQRIRPPPFQSSHHFPHHLSIINELRYSFHLVAADSFDRRERLDASTYQQCRG